MPQLTKKRKPRRTSEEVQAYAAFHADYKASKKQSFDDKMPLYLILRNLDLS